MIQFTKATKKKSRARIAIDGPSGAGKTYTSLIAATVLAKGGKIAVIDTERGSASLYSDEFDFDVLELSEFSPATYTAAIDAAEKAGYAVIVIDSLSHAWEGEGGALDMVDKAAARAQGNSYVGWKDVTPLHRRMVDAMLQSPAHVIATMRSKMDHVQEKDDRGKTIVRKIGMAPIQRQGMEYEFTFVADMDIDHRLIVSKSRCKVMADAVVMKPGAAFWQPFMEWLDSGADAEQKPEPPGMLETAQALGGEVVHAEPAPTTTTNGKKLTGKRPFAPVELRANFVKAVSAIEARGMTLTETDFPIVSDAVQSMLGTEEQITYLKYVTGVGSLDELTEAEIIALKRLLKPVEAGGTWLACDEAVKEARAVIDEPAE